MPELRPMRDEDVAAVHELSAVAFADLGRRLHDVRSPSPDVAAAHLRLRHLLGTDPDGAWVAETKDGSLAGAALAIRREAMWGLSLLVVAPQHQSGGLGRALLRRTLGYGAETRGGIILASPDSRALRAYARAGFDLHPTVYATGKPDGVFAPPEVLPFTPDDHALAAEVDRAVRGAAHGGDLDVLAASGCELLTLPDRGYAVHRDGKVVTIAAFEEPAAAVLLRAVLARVPAGAAAEVEWLTGRQRWAIEVAVEARLRLSSGGAVFLRGDTGPFHPYLPGGAYL